MQEELQGAKELVLKARNDNEKLRHDLAIER